jgi:hypothetical protein
VYGVSYCTTTGMKGRAGQCEMYALEEKESMARNCVGDRTPCGRVARTDRRLLLPAESVDRCTSPPVSVGILGALVAPVNLPLRHYCPGGTVRACRTSTGLRLACGGGGRGAGTLTTNTCTAGVSNLDVYCRAPSACQRRQLAGQAGVMASLLLASLLLLLASMLLASLLPGWAASGGVRVLVALVCSACCCCC